MHRLVPLLLTAAIPCVLAASASAQHADFYVSPNGDDRWSGKLASPNAEKTDGPFASPGRARDAVRTLRLKLSVERPVKVLLRDGRHELTEPLRFGPEDSGSEKAPIVYAAYPGESPVLSGGRLLKGWRKEKDRWTLSLAEVKAGTWTFRQLFVNGRRAHRSRLPKEGFFTVAGYAGIDQKKYNTPSDRFEFSPGDLRGDWKNLSDVECVVLHFWVDTHLKIASVDEAKRVVTFDRFSRRRFSDDYRGKGARYYVENVFEALEPGQFYLDRPSGILHYLPREKETLDAAEIIAPRLERLITFEGDPNKNRFVEHIHLRGLTFSDTDWQLPPKEAGDAQAASNVPGALVLTGARHCVIEGCTLKNLGTYAIDLREGCRHNRVVHNEIADCAAGGIKLNGGAAGSPEWRRTGDNIVSDNHLHHLGRIFHSGVGILSMHSAGNTFAHNHIHHLYYTAISVGWVWGYGPSVSRDNKIEFNHLHDIGQGMLSDMGGVYLLGAAPGTVVRNNRIHDVDSWSYGGWGIYTDEGSTGVLIENNLVYRTKSGGFHQHYGKDNVVRNNIFALARTEQVARSRAEPHRSFTFERNIIYFHEGELLGKNWTGDGFVIDRNLYWNPKEKIRFPGGDFASWQKRGHDRDSVIGDPRFVAVERDDFALAPGSPALKLGFEALELSTAGPRKK